MNAPTITNGVPSTSLAPGVARMLLQLSKARGAARYWQGEADKLQMGDKRIEGRLRLAQLHREVARELEAELLPPTFSEIVRGALHKHFNK